MILRHAANGEILGVALLMEDVLQSGQQEIVMSPDEGKGEDQLIESERPGSAARPKSSASVRSKSSQQSHAEEDVEEEKKDVTGEELWKILPKIGNQYHPPKKKK